MAGTNPEPPVIDDDKEVTEADLRALKESMVEVETPNGEDDTPETLEANEDTEDTGEGDDQIDAGTEEEEQAEVETPEAPPKFVKQFEYIKGDTPEEYAKNLEAAYTNSSSEALRLKNELDTVKAPPVAQPELSTDNYEQTPAITSVADLYVQQKLDDDIKAAFEDTKKDYPQVVEPDNYAQFTKKVATFSKTILDSDKRLASPEELYSMAAISLGWEKATSIPDPKEKLGQALKEGASSSKASAAPSKPAGKGPSVSEAQIKLNMQMYPGKTRQEIIDELSPYQV